MIVESYEDVVILTGTLNANYWETIHTAVSLTLKRHPSGVIIDCSGVTHATEQGALTFHDALDFLEKHEGSRIIVAAVRPEVLAVLKDAPEVRSQLPIVATVEEARRSLDVLEGSKSNGKKRREVRTDVQVLVVLQGVDSDMDVIAVAKEMVNNLSAKVTLLLPVVVPRDLPLNAPMVDREESEVKSAARARDCLDECGTPYDLRLERTRDLAVLLQEISEEIAAAYTVVAVSTDKVGEEIGLRQIKSILEKVKRPVLFVRGFVG